MTLIVLLPWHAPLWWMLRRLRRAIEYDCDARVLRAQPDVRRYASLLVLVSAHRRPSRTSLSFLAHMVFMSSASAFTVLRQRIALMTQPPQARRPVRSLAVLTVAASVALTALVLPTPPSHLDAQAVPPTASRKAETRSATDGAREIRYVVSSGYVLIQGKRRSPMYLLQEASLLSDQHAGFTTINVASKSGRPTLVDVFVERTDSSRSFKADTSRLRTPFSLVRSSDMPMLHIRSVNGDTIRVLSPTSVVPEWASQVSGLHFILRGVNFFGIVQR